MCDCHRSYEKCLVHTCIETLLNFSLRRLYRHLLIIDITSFSFLILVSTSVFVIFLTHDILEVIDTFIVQIPVISLCLLPSFHSSAQTEHKHLIKS